MTALFLYFFITMILVDCKITNFYLYFFINIFGNKYICEYTSATSKERMTMNIIFAGATPIN